ncbi:hypothetical protein MAR_025524 [Mya arenaria]|uniref:Uncharacterized protein n=1 Tax=Mya arenaria TaxID=6604 RepID=A0ABY7ESG8_MYAAR|nr:hypothetical protein MAR_025524 [Mya arenaria]
MNETTSQTFVPKPEIRVHKIGFGISAFVSSDYEEDSKSAFTLKTSGNSRCRFFALAVRKTDSKNPVLVIRLPNNMKFSPRLYEVVSQKTETAAYISDCDLLVITEVEASISFNFNTDKVHSNAFDDFCYRK